MHIEMIRGCVCDYLGIDDIREIDMTDEQRKQYFKEICEKIVEIHGFNFFLQVICEAYGDYSCSKKPCEQCGDYIETFVLDL